MKQFVTLIFLVLTMLLYTGPASAKTFYLSDGSSIKYQRVWKQGDRIYLLVNRDTLIDFAPDEVNQRKTLKAAGKKNFPRLTEKMNRPVRSCAPAVL